MVTKLILNPLVIVGILMGRAVNKMLSWHNDGNPHIASMAGKMGNCGDSCAWFNMNIGIMMFPKTHIGILEEFWPSDERQAEQTVAITYRGYILLAIRPCWSSTYTEHVMHWVSNFQNRGNHDMAEGELITFICDTFRDFFSGKTLPEGCENVQIPHPDWPLLVSHDHNKQDNRYVRFRNAGEYPFDKTGLMMKRSEITEQQAAVALGCTIHQLASFENKAYTLVQIDSDTKIAFAVYKHDFRWWFIVLNTENVRNIRVSWVLDMR